MSKKFLIEWAENYFRSRDIFHKKIISLESSEDRIKITYKDKQETIFVFVDLSELVLEMLCEDSSIITINSRSNLDFLLLNWDKFACIKSFKLYFINPFSTTEPKWIIHPYIHSKIAEPSALKIGLISLFGTVEPLTKEMLAKRLGSTEL